MIARFEGDEGRARLFETLKEQTLVTHDEDLARAIAGVGSVEAVDPGQVVIEQDGADDDVLFIVAGSFDIVVNGRVVARRHAGDHVGEMAAVVPTQRRSATVVCGEPSCVVRLRRNEFIDIANTYPRVWQSIAKELSRRLIQRNALLTRRRERPRVFIMSSTESLPIAREIQLGFEHDPFTVEVWTDGVFTASRYALEDLERELDDSDFGVAVAAGYDIVVRRGLSAATPRDNVTFELGFFMGRLGRERTLLLAPKDEQIRLPSDLLGLNIVPFRWETGARSGGATCTNLY